MANLQKYEIKIGEEWYPVQGTTLGLTDGWLSWKDEDGSSGLSRPGTWRVAEINRRKKTATKDSKA